MSRSKQLNRKNFDDREALRGGNRSGQIIKMIRVVMMEGELVPARAFPARSFRVSASAPHEQRRSSFFLTSVVLLPTAGADPINPCLNSSIPSNVNKLTQICVVRVKARRASREQTNTWVLIRKDNQVDPLRHHIDYSYQVQFHGRAFRFITDPRS